MSGYTSLLLKISNELEKSDLKTMKYCCKEYGIGARVLEDISDGLELFKELEKRNLLGPDNKDILLELLEKADRIDLKNKVLGTQGSATSAARSSQESSATDGPVASNIVQERHLIDIAEDLGRDWKQLGRKLDINSSILSNIEEEDRRVKDRCMSMLLRWKKRSGNDATGQVLANALIAIGRRDVAETLANVCQRDGIHVCINDERGNTERRTQSGGLNTMRADLEPRLPTQESDR